MRKILLLLCALLAGVSGAWADVLPNAVVGTTAFQATALTTGASGHTITKDGSGNVTISPNAGCYGETSGRFTCTLVIKINVPSTTTEGVLCEMRQGSGTTASQGLYMLAERKLKTSFQAGGRNVTPFQLDAGEHTIIYTTGDPGTNVYVDGTSRVTDSGLKESAKSYTAIYIPSTYASCITEVHFFASIQNATNISAINTECSNHMHASQQAGTTANVASGTTLILDKAVSWTSLTGAGTVLQEVNINTTVAGNLPALTLKATAGTLTYTGSNLNGTTLDGVILEGSARIDTGSSTVNIKNLAGNNISGTNGYAFVGSGTLNIYGTCDLTKQSDGTTNNGNNNLGYGAGATINIKENANVTTGPIYNSYSYLDKNSSIIVESEATLNCTSYYIIAESITNNGTITAPQLWGPITLADGSATTLSNATPFNNGAITVSGDATVNLTNATSALNQAISVAEGKTLTINGGSNTVNLTSAVSGSGDIVLSYFPTAATHPTLSSWTGTFEFPQPASDQGNLTTIFNAWGNENSVIKLHSVTGWLEASITVNPTLNILNGATVNINNGYSNNTPELRKLTGEGILAQTWTASAGTYALHIGTLTGFTGTLQGTNKPIVVKKLVMPDPPYVNTRLIKTTGDVTLEKLYIGLGETTAYSWVTKTVEAVEGIYVSALDQVQLYRDMAVAAVTPYFANIGAGVGQYTISLGVEKYTTISDFETAILAWADVKDCSLANVTINQPTSAFYRIKSGSKYLQDARKSDSQTQRTLTDTEGADESAETIFYLDDNTFIGYKTGYGFGFSVCQTRDTEHLNTQLFTESAEMGKYTIQSQQGTCTSAAYNEGYWGVNGSELSRENSAANGACWTIESVPSLPVTISSAGYATFCSPVAVTIPVGVTAYVGTLDHRDYLHLEAIEGGTIPANQGVILKGAEGTYNFTLTEGGSAAGNLLTGTVAAIARPANSYVLSGGDYGLGFYQDGAETIPGFKAYLQPEVVGGVKGFLGFNFDDVDAIENIVKQISTNDEYYDLSGRRVSKPTKGMYIINGKKALVK